MKPFGFQANPMQPFVDSHVEGVGVRSNPEFDIAGNPAPVLEQSLLVPSARLNKRQLSPGGIDNHETWSSEAAARQVDVPLGVHSHPVAPVFKAEVDKGSWGTGDEPLWAKGESVNLHRASFWFRIRWFQAVSAVVMIAHIQGLLIRAQNDAVWFFGGLSDLDHMPFTVEAIHSLALQFAWFGASVTGVGKINPSFEVHAQVVWGIETATIETVSQGSSGSSRQVPANESASSAIGPIARNHGPIPLKGQAVGLAGVGSEHGNLGGSWMVLEDHAIVGAEWHVGEVDAAIRRHGRAFGQAAVEPRLSGVQKFQL